MQKGIVILLLNLDGNTTVQADVSVNLAEMRKYMPHYRHVKHAGMEREEYHLTPLDGNIQSQTVLLNGNALTVDSFGFIPALEPVRVNPLEPIRVAPHSIAFIHMPNVAITACQ